MSSVETSSVAVVAVAESSVVSESKKKRDHKKKKTACSAAVSSETKVPAKKAPVDRIPVTVLTGFLGSGKTTLLNRVLKEAHGMKIAVIENEFGEIGIDQALVIHQDEELVEMNNGCICCTVRGDLIKILMRLYERRDKIDRVLIETTGLADPGPVAQTFFVDEDVCARFKLDGILTVVDAYHIAQALNHSKEAQEQIAFADVVCLNKTDLVKPEDLDVVEARIRAMNGQAKVHRTVRSNISIPLVLNMGGFNVKRALEVDPKFFDPEYPFEWAGVYNLAPGNYRLAVPKGPDETMGTVLMSLTVNETKASTEVKEAKKEAKTIALVPATSLSSTDTSVVAAATSSLTDLAVTDPFAAAISAECRQALLLFSSDLKDTSIVRNKKGMGVGPRYSVLDLSATGESQFPFTIPAAGGGTSTGTKPFVLFTEHQPKEFNMRLELVGDATTTISPVFEFAFKPDHEHDDEVTSVGIQLDEPVDEEKLNTWLGGLLRTKGESIYRMKGVLNVAGSDDRFVFHGVHMLFNGQVDRAWEPNEKRASTMIFIGRNLDRTELTTSFYACRARPTATTKSSP